MKQLLMSTLLSANAPLIGRTNNVYLASLSWLASAAIAAVVAGTVSFYVKYKEYEKEYFKKAIEKRRKAIKSIEDATALLKLRHLAKNPDGSTSAFQPFLILSDSQEVFKNTVAATYTHVIWHSTQTAKAFNIFAGKVSQILRQGKGLDEAERQKLAVTEFHAIEEAMGELHQSLSQDRLTLHEVKAFLNKKLEEFK